MLIFSVALDIPLDALQVAVLMSMFHGLFDNLALGLHTALSPLNLYYCFLGVLVGKFIGVLPGIGALVGLSLLLPITFHLHHTAAIVMLAGVYYGSTYGGSVASILLNMPGTPTNAVTCLEGYPMARQGRSGVALLMTTVASFFGASIGIIIMTLFSPLIVDAALEFGPAEYFSMMVLGLVAASTVATGAPAKGIAMVLLGLLLGRRRLRHRNRHHALHLGHSRSRRRRAAGRRRHGTVRRVGGDLQRPRHQARPDRPQEHHLPLDDPDARRHPPLLDAGDPRHGDRLLLRRPARHRRRDRLLHGLCGREEDRRRTRRASATARSKASWRLKSANNAADQTAFIPTMTLGIPGNVVMALMIGALTIHGIVPGPQLMVKEPELFWGVLMSFWVGNVMLLFLSIPLIGIWIRILAIPYHWLYPAIMLFVASACTASTTARST